MSVVVAARNDNHGGNLLHRMQLFVTGLFEQARRFALAGELILVEWNPPLDKPSLAQVLDWRGADARFGVRIIQVPNAIHARRAHSNRLPFFQMIAKNVGIRRARGKFVLATNVDVLFSDELMARLATPTLQAGWLYRANRYDVPAAVPSGNIETQLAYCRKNSSRIFLRNGIFSIAGADSIAPLLLWMGSSPGAAATLARWLWRGWHSIASPKRAIGQAGVHPSYAAPIKTWFNANPLPALHYNACGDFTLLAMQDWCELRGYPEMAMYSLHLDSLLCLNAHYANIREHVWDAPVCIYHMEHAEGWTNNAQTNQALLHSVGDRKLPMLSMEQLGDYAKQMQAHRRHLDFNGDDWGLASEHLSESIFQ